MKLFRRILPPIWLFILGMSVHGQVTITEFLANNSHGITDSDGDHSDWIELHNSGPLAVNLAGWQLTDDAAQLGKWRLPSTNLPPGGFLIIFASGKDRAVPGAPLHASFTLNEQGEYLGLVKPDGQTIATEFAPAFPKQRADVSFGLGQSFATTSFVTNGATAAIRVPLDNTLGLTWTGDPVNEPFDDSASAGWIRGRTGIGFDSSSEGTNTVGNPLISRPATDSAVGSIFVLASSEFALTGTLQEWAIYSDTQLFITPLLLRLNPDGNYVITGIGKARKSVLNGHVQRFPFELQSGSAQVGPEYFLAWKDGSNGANNAGVAPFTDNTSEGVRWFQAHGSFAIGNDLGAGTSFSRAYSLQATAVLTLAGFVRTNVASIMRGTAPSAFIRLPFVVPAGEVFDSLTLRLRYEDGFAAYLNGTELVRRNTPEGALRFDSVAATNRSKMEAVLAEVISLPGFTDALRTGTNILAFQGLNDSVGSSDFLIAPELTGAKASRFPNRFLLRPTPGQANDLGVTGLVADTQFSVKRGLFAQPFPVSITTETEGAKIYYTTNGSRPNPTNAAAILYSAPVQISATTTLRAAAFQEGFEPTGVDTQTYLFTAQVANQPANPPGFPTQWSDINGDYQVDRSVVTNTLPGYDLETALRAIPSVSITADPADLFGVSRGIYYNSAAAGLAWERAASVELINPDGSEGFQIDAGIRISGASSRNHSFTPKHSILMSFKQPFGPAKLDFPMFADSSVHAFDKLILRACSTDSWSVQDGYVHQDNLRWDPRRATYMHDQWMRDTQLATGQASGHGRYVHLYLNGLYWGLF